MEALNLITPHQKRKRGNPNWGNGRARILMTTPQFDQLMTRLELDEDHCLHSLRVRRWIRENLNKRYVPEHLLYKLGLEVKITTCSIDGEKIR